MIYAMIPAREGSERLKWKNLALLDGKPLISHVTETALKVGAFDQIIINSDSAVFSSIADSLGVNFYQRPKPLGASSALSDDVVADFFSAFPDCEYLFWINPIAPLLSQSDIEHGLEILLNEADSVMAVTEKQVHANFRSDPINYDPTEKFAKTQDLVPIELFCYSLMGWRRASFCSQYEANEVGLLSGEFKTFCVSDHAGLIVKTAADLQLIEAIMRSDNKSVQYHSLVNKLPTRE